MVPQAPAYRAKIWYKLFFAIQGLVNNDRRTMWYPRGRYAVGAFVHSHPQTLVVAAGFSMDYHVF